ncbi:MAG: hypothetical protein K5890_07335 [Bacteroidales bacterium]|nr:hypothetical protein [Bacteroidales bacterium]
MKHYSVKVKAGGHLIKAIVAARNIRKASRMMEAIYPEILDHCGCFASIRLLCCK